MARTYQTILVDNLDHIYRRCDNTEIGYIILTNEGVSFSPRGIRFAYSIGELEDILAELKLQELK